MFIPGVKAAQASTSKGIPGYIMAWANLYPWVYYGLMGYALA